MSGISSDGVHPTVDEAPPPSKKQRTNWLSSENLPTLLTAVEEYRCGGVSVSSLTRKYKIPHNTLKHHIKKSGELLKKRDGREVTFVPTDEKEISTSSEEYHVTTHFGEWKDNKQMLKYVFNQNKLLMKGKVIVDLTHGEGNFLPKSSSYGGAVTVRFDK